MAFFLTASLLVLSITVMKKSITRKKEGGEGKKVKKRIIRILSFNLKENTILFMSVRKKIKKVLKIVYC